MVSRGQMLGTKELLERHKETDTISGGGNSLKMVLPPLGLL